MFSNIDSKTIPNLYPVCFWIFDRFEGGFKLRLSNRRGLRNIEIRSPNIDSEPAVHDELGIPAFAIESSGDETEILIDGILHLLHFMNR